MKLTFDPVIARAYTSPSQRARVMTEHWVHRAAFCPNCGQSAIEKYPNNRPVADFFCGRCHEDFELKSKQDRIGSRILDGAYRTMIERLRSGRNPNLLLLNYDLASLAVLNFLVIPKHFFVPDIIERRKPLAPLARRAGWIGCNILLNRIPDSGKIFFVKEQRAESKVRVLCEWRKTLFLRQQQSLSRKGWLLDVMRSIEKLGKREFTLQELYAFESELSALHPENKHVRPKMRQQLQVLRDQGFVNFLSPGVYRLAAR